MGGGTWAKAGRGKRVPLATSPQHEKDGFRAHPVRRAGPTATEKVRVLVHGQKRLHQGPKLVGQPEATARALDALGVGTAADFFLGGRGLHPLVSYLAPPLSG